MCKDEYRQYTVIPGNGKRTIIILYDIYLLEDSKAYYTEFLENYGFGGSILIEGYCHLKTFDRIMLQEEKLGALIHNTGMWHGSTLDELFQYCELSDEEKKKLFNLPHNKNGSSRSENLLCDQEFLNKIVNFF